MTGMGIPQWESRWVVCSTRSLEGVEPGPPDENGNRWFSLGDGKLLGFVVRTGNSLSHTPEDYEVEFDANEEDAAKALAAEFNRYEWQGPLDSEFEARRDRLKKIAPGYGSFYYEGPTEARFPVRPGRYLIHDGGVGWHAEASDELADDLDDVREAIAGVESNIYSVIDLDTGDEVPFGRSVSVDFSVRP